MYCIAWWADPIALSSIFLFISRTWWDNMLFLMITRRYNISRKFIYVIVSVPLGKVWCASLTLHPSCGNGMKHLVLVIREMILSIRAGSLIGSRNGVKRIFIAARQTYKHTSSGIQILDSSMTRNPVMDRAETTVAVLKFLSTWVSFIMCLLECVQHHTKCWINIASFSLTTILYGSTHKRISEYTFFHFSY